MALVRLSRSICALSTQHSRCISHTATCKLAQDQPTVGDTNPATTAVSASTSKSGSPEVAKQDWTEVVDEKTGGTYYWNQSTGETTNVGDPKPVTRFRDPEYEEYYKNHRKDADPQDIFAPSWKEPGQPDRTMYYIFLGGLIGIFAGWTARFTH